MNYKQVTAIICQVFETKADDIKNNYDDNPNDNLSL